jgi:hypothetical protein
MKQIIIRATVLLVTCFCGSAFASIVGMFQLGGATLTGSATGITFSGIPSVSGQTGIYSGLPVGGVPPASVSLQNILFAADPIGQTFGPVSFIGFPLNPFSALQLSFIAAGVFGSAGCSANPPASLQLCTPALPPALGGGASPYNFQNTANGGSTLSFILSGVSADGQDTWNGIFTSQFTSPFQTVLLNFSTGTPFTNIYSAQITVSSASSVPEPSTVTMLILALLVMLSLQWRSARISQSR